MHQMKPACLLLLWFSTHAFGAPGTYYDGTTQDKTTFTLYLDGGEFLGPQGAFHAIKTDLHVSRQGREIKTTDSCRFIYNPKDREHDSIACASPAGGRLRGVVYERDKPLYRNSHGAAHDMVCTQHCGPKVPKRLTLTEEEDNG